MVPAVLNLYVDKPFVQLIKHCHLTKQRKEKSILYRQAQSIDLFPPFVCLVEWKCSINCTKGLSTYRFQAAGTIYHTGRKNDRFICLLQI